jgi:hypothetical protein
MKLSIAYLALVAGVASAGRPQLSVSFLSYSDLLTALENFNLHFRQPRRPTTLDNK